MVMDLLLEIEGKGVEGEGKFVLCGDHPRRLAAPPRPLNKMLQATAAPPERGRVEDDTTRAQKMCVSCTPRRLPMPFICSSGLPASEELSQSGERTSRMA